MRPVATRASWSEAPAGTSRRTSGSGSGPWFVAEGDEYDTAFFDKGPKFLHYDPDALLLNAIEFDHADIYRDLDHVKRAFRTLLDQLRPSAALAASADFPEVRAVVAASGREAVFFGTGPGAAWRAEDVGDDGTATRFTIVGPAGVRRPVALLLPGRINVANAVGVVALDAIDGCAARRRRSRPSRPFGV